MKTNLLENIREVLDGSTNTNTVEELTEILNGRDDGESWDVTVPEVKGVLDELVLEGMLEVVPEGYRCRKDYLAMRDLMDDLDFSAWVQEKYR